MSRPMKFRAWDSQTQRLYEVTGMWWSASTPGVLWRVELYHDAMHRTMIVTEETEIALRISLMQFTGLLDKNGHEIYEDDILKMDDATAKVVFWQHPPAFGLDFSHNEDLWCYDWTLAYDHDRMQVIGNVYEHPELLKEHA